MKAFVFGLTFLALSTQVFAQSQFVGAVIHNPIGVRADGTTGPVPFNGQITVHSSFDMNVTTQLGEPVKWVQTEPERIPAQEPPAPDKPIPYNPVDYWPRPTPP